MQDFFLRLASQAKGEPQDVAPAPEVRMAIYDSPLAPPQVVSLSAEDFGQLVGELAARTHNYARERGGRIPFVVIREIVENLIHALFQNAVVSIMDDGNTIRISDQGPGIRDKDHAFQPGFTTATREMRAFIKGVGSGLPVAREQLAFLGGAISIEDNLDHGTVVTLRVGQSRDAAPLAPTAPSPRPAEPPRLRLSDRQRKVLLLIAELGSAGPSTIAKELGISQSTAFRELAALQKQQLLAQRTPGKRTLTEDGIAYLGNVFRP
ncbi:MAG TPA: ATP-binding protein [Candidatus Acidoferrales bacterium]|nr:ATP-binding protein [Candidatus Acidoferrales bacterium]